MSEQVSILIPNYNTELLTKLCMRSLRKFTPEGKAKFLVIDNGSTDGSLAYLKTLPWITLVENPDPKGTPPDIHSQSLDKLMKLADTEFVLSIHTDTIVLDPEWLDFLLSRMDDPHTAGTGSWKMEHVSPLKKAGLALEHLFKRVFITPFRKESPKEEFRYFRSHCALFRTGLVKNETRGFFDGEVAGKSLFRMLTQAGYKMEFLKTEELEKYLIHFNHGTMILNPELGGKRTSRPEARAKLGSKMKQFQEILNDSSLDR